MSEQWTDERIDNEIKALNISMAYDLAVIGLMRRMRDQLTASHTDVLNTVLRTNAELISALNDEVKRLRRDAEKLEALQQAGVDNWDGYGEAMELLREWQANKHS